MLGKPDQNTFLSVTSVFSVASITFANINSAWNNINTRALSLVTFTSTSRLFHSFGSIAATVRSPSAGRDARLRMNFSACLKLQNVSGNSA